jgi:hypothetical protein
VEGSTSNAKAFGDSFAKELCKKNINTYEHEDENEKTRTLEPSGIEI